MITDETIRRVLKFRDDRDWRQFHTPKDLAISLNLECAELLELFQWLNPPDVEKLLNGEDPAYVARIAEEFADVMMYGMQLMRALKIDVSAEIEHKIEVVRGRPANRKNLHPFQ